MLDPLMTIFRPVSAFITAIAAGISENIFGKKDEAAASPEEISCECCGTENKHAPADHKFIQKIKYGMSYAFIDLLGDIAKWLIIGIVIGGIISYFTPANFVERFLGSDFKAMLVMLVIGKRHEPWSGAGISSGRTGYQYCRYSVCWKILRQEIRCNISSFNFGLRGFIGIAA
jgi:uncharacterized membrane protein YraQ (UPF0718 family)